MFYGEEKFLKNNYIKKLKKNILRKNEDIMNLDIFEGKNINIEDLENSSYTIPFMGNYRLIIVKDSEIFTSSQKEKAEKLSNFIENISESTIIIFSEEEVDKRNKLFKLINNIGYVVDFKILKEDDLVKWVIDICNKKNINISKETARKFINTVTLDMNTIKLELDKIINYKNKGEEIKFSDIDLITTKSIDSRIFNLVYQIGNKNCEKALEEYKNLIISKEQPIIILSMIGRQFRIILQCVNLYEKGYVIEEISEKLSLRSFIVKECIKQSKNFKKDTLISALKDCLTIDINIKTGKILKEILALEMLIVKYST